MLTFRKLLAIVALVSGLAAAAGTMTACGDDGHDHAHDVGDGDGD